LAEKQHAFCFVSFDDRAIASRPTHAPFVFVLTLLDFRKIVGRTQRQKK
jgi:hypothetical protein